MRVLTLDAEYNQPSGSTVQIGAAAYHLPTGELLGTFDTYVDCGELVSEHITNVTGIRTGDILGSPNIREAFEDLRVFHKKFKCFKNPLVWGAGEKNDSQHLYQEAYPNAELRAIHTNFMGYRVIDVKGMYQSIQLLHNKTVSGSLADVCEKVGIGFEGDPHRALPDAVNTFRLWFHLTKKFPGSFK